MTHSAGQQQATSAAAAVGSQSIEGAAAVSAMAQHPPAADMSISVAPEPSHTNAAGSHLGTSTTSLGKRTRYVIGELCMQLSIISGALHKCYNGAGQLRHCARFDCPGVGCMPLPAAVVEHERQVGRRGSVFSIHLLAFKRGCYWPLHPSQCLWSLPS